VRKGKCGGGDDKRRYALSCSRDWVTRGATLDGPSGQNDDDGACADG
jgi:hypothetical protein